MRRRTHAACGLVASLFLGGCANGRSLHERAVAYRHVLERAVVETPSPMAVDAERALTRLRQQIAEAKLG